MNDGLTRIALIVLTTLAFATSAQAEHLAPRDECRALDGVEDFRRALATAVANRDADMLRPLLHPRIHLDFGGGNGPDLLIERLAADEFQTWPDLDMVQRLGCAVDRDGSLSMPYFFSQEMPKGYDAHGTYIAIGSDVPVYISETGTEVIANLDWEAVQLVSFLETVEDFEEASRWEVQRSDGMRGFVDPDRLRALIDYRLRVSREEGIWLITSFVAGD